jgi:protein involved in polysaccharide export with SLBB domain
MTSHDLAFALLRTTLVTSAAAWVAALLLAWLKVDSPRTHRVAWLLVVAQGWLLIPWTYEIETLPPPPPPAAQVVEMPRAFVSMEPTDVTFVAARPHEEPPAPFPIAAVSIFAWFLGAAVFTLFAAVRYATIVRTLPRGEALDDPQWQREWRRAVRCLTLKATGSAGGLPSPRGSRRAWWQIKPLGRHAPVRVGMRTLLKHMLTRTRACHPNSSSSHRVPCFRPRKHASRVPCFRPRKHAVPRIDFRLTTNLGPLVAFIPWRYLLLAPRPLWTALTSPERTAILRHELAHIRRRDLWKSLAFRILALPQWFNPLVWLAARRFDEAAEWQCDRAAVGRRATAARGLARNQTTLASSLLRTAELASLKRPPRTLGFLAAVPPYRPSTPNRRTALARRIERLVTPRLKEESLMKRLALPALLALVAAAQLIRIEHVAAQNPPPSKGGARGGIHDAASSLLGANLSQGGGSEIVALVDGQFIRASEVLWQVRNLIEKANAPIPPEHVAEAEQMLMRQLVTGLIDTKLLYADFRRTVPAESLTKIEESLAKPFEAEEIPRLLRMLQLENRLELETTLAHSGTSLHDVQRQFNERSIASEWLRQLMPKSPPVTDEQLQAYYRDHQDEHGDVPFAEAQATIRERLEKEQEKILLEATMNKLRAAARTWTIFDGHVPAMGSAESAASGVLNDIIATTVYQSHGREFTPKSPASELRQHDVITVEPSEDTQAILDELAAARKAGDYHREVRAYFKLPYIIEPPDILEISIEGEATGRGVNSDAGVTDALKIEKMQCLVAMDGKINLGSLGSISVAGLTAPQARDAIKAHVDGEIKDAEVLVNVLRNNSKVFYIITKGGGRGDNVVRAPITGNETVIDAVASLGEMHLSSQTKMWIARPAPNGVGNEEILTVAWNEIASGQSTATNYQLLPGDRLFVDKSDDEAPTQDVKIEYAWNGTSGPRHAKYGLAKGDTVGKLMARLLRRENRLHGSMLEQVIGVPEVFSGAEILIRRPADSERHQEEKWSARWDDAYGRIIAGDDLELRGGDKLFVTLLDVKVSSSPIPDGDPWVEIHVEGSDEMTQRVRFNRGLTIAEAVAAMTPPLAIDFAKASVVHCRPQPGSSDLSQATFLTIKWEAEDAPNRNFELRGQDFIRIDPAGMPYNPLPRPVDELPVAPAAPAQANSGYYRPTAPRPAIAGAPAPPIPDVGPQPAIPANPAVPIPTVTPDGKSWVGYMVAWEGAGGRQSWNSHEEFQKGDTVGSVVKRLVERGHLRMLEIPKIDLSAATVILKRETSSSSRGWVVPWDKVTDMPPEGEDRALEPNDFIVIGLSGVAPAVDDAVSIVLKLEAGKESGQPIPFKVGLTVADLIAVAVLPNPIDFAKTRMMLFKPDAGSADPSRGQVLPIIWEAGRPTKETNYAVTPGAALIIDLTPPTSPQPPLPPGTTVESVIGFPQPSTPQATPAPPTPNPLAENISYKLSFLEDASGDLAEFVDEGEPGAIRDTAALEPALRILKKHGLVKVIADPKIITQSGRPAEFNLGEPVPGKDRVFRNAQHVKVISREAPSLTTSGPARKRPALNVEIEANADHAGERQTLEAAFQLSPGQSAIARFKAKDGSASPIYLVVTPNGSTSDALRSYPLSFSPRRVAGGRSPHAKAQSRTGGKRTER